MALETNKLRLNSEDLLNRSKLSVFQQNWWVGIAGGGASCREARVLEDGLVVGVLPYAVNRNRLGLQFGGNPHWSRLGGPIVSQTLNDDKKIDVLRQLIAQLPRRVSFHFVCDPHLNDVHIVRQAFKEAGFEHTSRTTYLQPPQDAGVMMRLNKKHRSHIRSANKKLDIIQIDADEFTAFYQVNLDAVGKKAYSPLNVARNLLAEGLSAENPRARIFAARRKWNSDSSEAPPLDAAIACTWDDRRYYFWMATRRIHFDASPHEKPHPDATKLLIVKATEHAQELGLTFDADGVTSPGTENLYQKILGLPRKEFREDFLRTTRFARWYERYRYKIKTVAAVFGLA
jgi:hypothetical protein